ncbi:6-hydroxymethylpterin diphosphokinase MptE-like protein [Haloprofundus salilacus]|uniref:6-hydroxymethylpterin diphosphokinase MptE-like protein n=1 Tax=Haloprofundus salilacus TaxID=2876190 RepID=UPI001CCE71F0|nr:6-hydroxymethylpterin diphosphokinase MptE-like protein [Haloprofundus salilacus]
MNFETWEPVYERLLAEFGFDREADERARDELAELSEPFDESRLRVVDGASVAVVGAAPSLADEVDRAAAADYVFAASTAVDVLCDRGVSVDLMVTDLDKNPETARELTRRGVPVAAHAHGDNRSAIREWVPRFRSENVLATTQAAPVGAVVDYGGFTDGDRAAFLADEFGARELKFAGWQFDDPTVDETKARKLAWAERLLGWLERRRGEQFSVLDGRRSAPEPLDEEGRDFGDETRE